MSPVAHTPNGDPQTYLNHLESAVEEWVRLGLVDVKSFVLRAINHPSDEALAEASKNSQDGSVVYNLNMQHEDGPTVTVAPAIPHTDETRAAAAEAAAVASGGSETAVPGPESPAPADQPVVPDHSETQGGSDYQEQTA